MKNEHDPDPGRVRKWTAPVTVWIDHQVAEQDLHTRLVTLHLNDLARITGHPISLATSESHANVIVVFAKFQDMAALTRQLMGGKAESILHGTLCLGNIQTDNRYVIHHASIIIPADQARTKGKLVSCITEELTQMLGLVNDSEAVYPSIFNDKTPNELLTGLDYLLLRLLYHPRVEPGMQTKEVAVTVRDIIGEMTKNGEVADAWRLVKESKLYPLLGY